MTVRIFYTGDLITPDGSDSSVYGDPCEPGYGAIHESGWVSPDWTLWEVRDDRDAVEPDQYTPDDGPLIDWAADTITRRLNGVEHQGADTRSIYSADSISDAYTGQSIMLAAHIEGMPDNLISAVIRLLAFRDASARSVRA